MSHTYSEGILHLGNMLKCLINDNIDERHSLALCLSSTLSFNLEVAGIRRVKELGL